jgi:hypothetical protein
MLANLLKIYTLNEENSWFKDFLEGIKEECLEIIDGFADFFMGIKEVVYDGAVEKFGEMPVNILLIGLGFLVLMLLFLKVVNK